MIDKSDLIRKASFARLKFGLSYDDIFKAIYLLFKDGMVLENDMLDCITLISIRDSSLDTMEYCASPSIIKMRLDNKPTSERIINLKKWFQLTDIFD